MNPQDKEQGAQAAGTASNTQNAAQNSAPAAGKIEQNRLMAILSYIGPLVIISYLVAKDEPFTKFHIKQGLVLLVANIALWVLASVAYPFWPLFRLCNLALFILAIIGIVNAAQGKEKELPLVGQWGKSFNI
jgi:uncharacterized membrane protein